VPPRKGTHIGWAAKPALTMHYKATRDNYNNRQLRKATVRVPERAGWPEGQPSRRAPKLFPGR